MSADGPAGRPHLFRRAALEALDPLIHALSELLVARFHAASRIAPAAIAPSSRRSILQVEPYSAATDQWPAGRKATCLPEKENFALLRASTLGRYGTFIAERFDRVIAVLNGKIDQILLAGDAI